MDGIINIHKEKGYTSHDVVAIMRGILKQRKIGHTGTLDPDATGVLPICLGKATKICEWITDMKKTYLTTCRLGVVTDTQDSTGNVIGRKEVVTSEKAVREAVHSFLGVREQIPPMYSAIKVNGKRLYELARMGQTVERKPRTVTFHEIRILELDVTKGTLKMEVVCSKGTYIRTLCHDIGERLGTGACMEDLVRTKVGRFAIEDGLTLSQVSDVLADGRLQEYVTPIDAMFESYVSVTVQNEHQKRVLNGGRFTGCHLRSDSETIPFHNGQKVRAYDEDRNFYGLYEYCGESEGFKPIKTFGLGK